MFVVAKAHKVAGPFRAGGIGVAGIFNLFAGVLAGAVLVAVGIAQGRGGTGSLVTGCLFLIAYAAMSPFLVAGWRGVVLTTTELVLPTRIFGRLRIPLNEVSGLGLGCVKEVGALGGRSNTWMLVAWRAGRDDDMYSSKRVTSLRPSKWQAMGSTRAARVTMKLYEAVLRCQGPGGNLARLHTERNPPTTTWTDSSLLKVWLPGEDRVVEI
jgi:hypothetical protein